MTVQRALWSFSLIGLLLIWNLPSAHADTPFETGEDIRIEAPTATVARQGEISRIHFRLVNGSSSRIHMIGLETALAREAQLVVRTGGGEYTTLGSYGVPAGETLDLTTSHLWYETGPVLRDSRKGESFPMTVKFTNGSLTIPVHVY